MLKTLDIENIAVIEKASVNFSGGLNVLTGETGAGKSIVVDSINAIMGERTSRELVRYGADNAYVSAYFDDICDSALNKLKEFDIELEEDNSLLITRKISANGKSLCKVNGKTVTVSMLKEICSYLVNVHGQHDSQALLNPDLQYNYIDMLLEDKSVLSDYKETFKKLISVRRKLKSFSKDEDNKESLLELLNFQIEELEKADIKVGEREELTQKRALIQKSEDIIKSLNLAISVINGDDENIGIEQACADVSRTLFKFDETKDVYDVFNDINDKLELAKDKAEALLLPIVEREGFELVDVEYVKEAGNWYLRGYIDKPGGITVNDCEAVSRRLSDILDEKDFIEDSYVLEVSSPGLGRPLKKEKDYKRNLGKEVEIRTYRMVDKKKEFTGLLDSYDYEAGTVTIELEDGTMKTFEKGDIALIRLAFDF